MGHFLYWLCRGSADAPRGSEEVRTAQETHCKRVAGQTSAEPFQLSSPEAEGLGFPTPTAAPLATGWPWGRGALGEAVGSSRGVTAVSPEQALCQRWGGAGPPEELIATGAPYPMPDTLGRMKWPKAKWILGINQVSKNTVVSFVYQTQQNGIKILLQNSI